jgi:hypothetical protein
MDVRVPWEIVKMSFRARDYKARRKYHGAASCDFDLVSRLATETLFIQIEKIGTIVLP